MLFPTKLHFILEIVSKDPKLSDIVSWLPCGRAFKIHDPVAFANIVLPKYFVGMHSFRSFRRQLNIYGIKKLLNKSRCLSLFLDGNGDPSEERTLPAKSAPDGSKEYEGQEELLLGAYFHPLFQRGRKDLTSKMIRSFTTKASSKRSRQSKKNAQPLRNHMEYQRSSLSDIEEFDLVLDGIGESVLFDDSSISTTTDCSSCSHRDNVMLMKELASCGIFNSTKCNAYLATRLREASFEHHVVSCNESSSSSLSSSEDDHHFICQQLVTEGSPLSPVKDSTYYHIDHEDIRREIVKTFMHM